MRRLACVGIWLAVLQLQLIGQQLTPASRLYWNPGPVDPTHPAATSYDATVDGAVIIDLGPCVQSPQNVDPMNWMCDAAVPAEAMAPGQHTIALRGVASTGVSAWTPVPPLDVTGIAQVPVPGGPLPPSLGPVILHQPPPLQLAVSPSLTVTAHSPQGTPVSYQAPVPSGGRSPYQVSCNPGSGSTFVVGITSVTCVVVDALSTQAQNSFSITVLFTAPPPSSTPWTIVGTAPVGTTTTKDALVIAPAEWLVSARKNGIQHTTDGGATFTAVNSGLGAGQTSVDTQILVQSNSGSILLSATCSTSNCPAKSGVFRYDATKSGWAQTAMQYPVNGFAIAPNTGELLVAAYVVNAGVGSWDVFRSTDDAATWQDITGKFSNGLPSGMQCGPDGTCWIAMTNDGVWMSMGSDYSKWSKVSGGPNGVAAFGFLNVEVYALGADIRHYDTTTKTFKVVAASGWNSADTVQSTYTSPTGLYLGTSHIQIGTYLTTDGQLFNAFQEGSWANLANSGMGVRVYALKNVGQQDVIAVLRDGRIYKATLP